MLPVNAFRAVFSEEAEEAADVQGGGGTIVQVYVHKPAEPQEQSRGKAKYGASLLVMGITSKGEDPMRAKILLAITCLTVVGALGSVQANHIESGCTGVVETHEVGDITIYVDDRDKVEGPYIYMENDAEAGYQPGGIRRGLSAEQPLMADNCVHENADTWVY